MKKILMMMAAMAAASWAVEPSQVLEYRVLATTKTSTMEREMNQAAGDGYRFLAAMGGETAFGGKETVVTMGRVKDVSGNGLRYKLLATSRTSTMQKEMADAAAEGYWYKGQTVFEPAFGGREVAVILERDEARGGGRQEYLLLATSKTSTMDKELNEAGRQGFTVVGMTVGKTAMRGSEVVCILGRTAR